MTTLYTFDAKTREFKDSRPAAIVGGKEITKTAYATVVAPSKDIPDGYVARWTGTEWETVEDHRQHTDEHGVKQGGTPYWLPSEGDNWMSQPRYMEDLGPLPEGAVTVKPEKPFETVKAEKLSELNAGLSAARNNNKSSIDSSVGFAINADDTCSTNVGGLIDYMTATGAENTSFMGFDNMLHEVTLADLKTMQTELAIYGQALYAYKWQVRAAIDTATTIEELEAIQIDYSQAKAIYASMAANA